MLWQQRTLLETTTTIVTPAEQSITTPSVFWSLVYVVFVLLFGCFCFVMGCVVALRKSTERRLNLVEQHPEEEQQSHSSSGFAMQLQQQSIYTPSDQDVWQQQQDDQGLQQQDNYSGMVSFGAMDNYAPQQQQQINKPPSSKNSSKKKKTRVDFVQNNLV